HTPAWNARQKMDKPLQIVALSQAETRSIGLSGNSFRKFRFYWFFIFFKSHNEMNNIGLYRFPVL
ncbi:MAG: hypothetical protein RBT04_06135, partial [Sphaerochaetaceae bacterium]|nr:hypothetical protein [Sphaerochaetaceae bacterium]